MSLFCNDIWVLFKTSVFLKMTSFCFRCLCAPNFYGIHCKDRSNDCASGTNQELCGHGVCVNHDRNGFTCICEQVSDLRINLKSVRLFDFQLHVISLFLVNILDSTFVGPWFWTTQSRSDDISMTCMAYTFSILSVN